MTKGSLGTKGFVLLTIPHHSLPWKGVQAGAQVRNLETGTEALKATYWFAQFASFLIYPGTTCLGVATGLGRLTSLKKKMFTDFVYRQSDRGAFLDQLTLACQVD